MTGAWQIVEWVGWATIAYYLMLVWRLRTQLSRLPKRFGLLPLVGNFLFCAIWFAGSAMSLRVCWTVGSVVLIAGIVILRRGLVQMDREEAAGLVEGDQTLRLS